MSQGLLISLWPSGPEQTNIESVFSRLLAAVIDSKPEEKMEVEVWRRQPPMGDDKKSVVFHRDWDIQTASSVIKSLAPFTDNDLAWNLRTCRDGLEWDYEDETPRPCKLGVDITYYGSEFERGYEHFESGPFQIWFYNKLDFADIFYEEPIHKVSASLRSRMKARGLNIPQPRGYRRFVSNRPFLDKLLDRICCEVNPIHLCVLNSGISMNPLNLYGVYHPTLSGYLYDVRKVLQLHELGGGYYYEGTRCTSRAPFKDSMDEVFSEYSSGEFDADRTQEEARALMCRLDHYVQHIGVPEPGELQLTDEEIFEALASAEGVELHEIGRSVMMVQSEMPLRCIESPYLQLLEKIRRKGKRVN